VKGLIPRSYIYHALARFSEYILNTATLFQDICQAILPLLPTDRALHFICDSFYNTAAVRTYLNFNGIFFTMACNTNWLPHVFRYLHKGLPHGEKKFLLNPAQNNTISCAYHSATATNTMSTAFLPQQTNASGPKIPTIFEEYHQKFNLVDLFDQLYFSIEFPHHQHTWKADFFDMIVKIAINNAWSSTTLSILSKWNMMSL
jgi:Transposase IS4